MEGNEPLYIPGTKAFQSSVAIVVERLELVIKFRARVWVGAWTRISIINGKLVVGSMLNGRAPLVTDRGGMSGGFSRESTLNTEPWC